MESNVIIRIQPYFVELHYIQTKFKKSTPLVLKIMNPKAFVDFLSDSIPSMYLKIKYLL